MADAAPIDWTSLTHEEPFDPKRRIIDAHHHLWGEGQGIGGSPAYQSEHLLADMAGHNVVGSVYVECDVAYLPDGPEHLRPVGETVFAASEAAKAAKTRSPILAIVSHADLALGDRVQEVLDAHVEAGNGLFRGIRQLPGGMHRPPRDLLGEAEFRNGVALLGRNGFSLDAFVPSFQLAQFACFAREVPDTLLIVNHLGMPLWFPDKGPREDVMAVWREGIRAIAECPNVYMKLGGVGMTSQFGMDWSKQEKPPASDVVVAWWGDDIRFCIEAFGPDRCLFESNFPVDRWGMGYTVLWNAFQKIAMAYGESEQEALFSGTATRAYRLA